MQTQCKLNQGRQPEQLRLPGRELANQRMLQQASPAAGKLESSRSQVSRNVQRNAPLSSINVDTLLGVILVNLLLALLVLLPGFCCILIKDANDACNAH